MGALSRSFSFLYFEIPHSLFCILIYSAVAPLPFPLVPGMVALPLEAGAVTRPPESGGCLPAVRGDVAEEG